MRLSARADRLPAVFDQYLSAIGSAIADYLLVCGVAYALFHLALARWLRHRKITQRPTGYASPLREVGRTVVSNLLGKGPFVLALAYLAHAQLIPDKWIYPRIADHGAPYFALTIAFDVLVFDLWFYLSDRKSVV